MSESADEDEGRRWVSADDASRWIWDDRRGSGCGRTWAAIVSKAACRGLGMKPKRWGAPCCDGRCAVFLF